MKPKKTTAPIRRWLSEPVEPDVTRSLARLAAAEDVVHVAVMPDVHLAGDVCNGVALATRELIYPAGVGGDIGCGMAALRFEADAALLRDEQQARRLLKGLADGIPPLRHSAATMLAELPAPLESPLSHPRLEKLKSRDGRVQFGTLGRGNHFVELQADDDDSLWLMVHSGSRAMGQAITAHHVALAEARSGRKTLPALSAAEQGGQDYLADVAWAIDYARRSRQAMMEATARVMHELFGVAVDPTSLIHSHHNHVQQETHGGEPLWVHRKGTLSAAEEEAGVIPGSMGTASFHVSGRGHEQALCSSSHGAGRVLSRTLARQQVSLKQLQQELADVWFDERQAQHLRDEAPSAYKDIRRVMRAQRELTRIVRTLRPLLCYKGT